MRLAFHSLPDDPIRAGFAHCLAILRQLLVRLCQYVPGLRGASPLSRASACLMIALGLRRALVCTGIDSWRCWISWMALPDRAGPVG